MDNINTGNLLIQMATLIITFIPIGGIIYNLGRRNQRQDKSEDEIKQGKTDINNIGEKVNKHKDYYNDTLSELRSKMESVNNSLAVVTTTVGLIKEKVDRL